MESEEDVLRICDSWADQFIKWSRREAEMTIGEYILFEKAVLYHLKNEVSPEVRMLFLREQGVLEISSFAETIDIQEVPEDLLGLAHEYVKDFERALKPITDIPAHKIRSVEMMQRKRVKEKAKSESEDVKRFIERHGISVSEPPDSLKWERKEMNSPTK